MSAMFLASFGLFCLFCLVDCQNGAVRRGPLSQMFPKKYPEIVRTGGVDPGEALFLSPLINAGKIQAGTKHEKNPTPITQ